MSNMRLAGICKDCMKRLGVDERLTIPLNVVQVSQLSEYNARAMANLSYPPSISHGPGGATKITYKIAKTVKESIDEGSHLSHTSQSSHPGGRSSKK